MTVTRHLWESTVRDDPRVTHNALLVALIYAGRAHWGGGRIAAAWPSQATTAKDARIGRTSVSAAIKLLRELGYLAVVPWADAQAYGITNARADPRVKLHHLTMPSGHVQQVNTNYVTPKYNT